MAEFEVVETFASLEEARVVVGYLQAHGVKAELANAHMHSVLPGGLPFSGYQVVAARAQAPEAKRLIESAARNAEDRRKD